MNNLQAEWTVMVFLNGDNNLERFSLLDFKEMAKVGSTEKVNIVVQFDRNGMYAPTPAWTQCLRFRVTKGMPPLPGHAVADLGEVNMGDGQVLADFVAWAMRAYPARRYMLDIWDHGQGWRVAESEPVTGAAADIAAHRAFRRRVIATEVEGRMARAIARGGRSGGPRARAFDAPTIPAARTINGGVRAISNDDTAGDQLFNREIQDHLLQTLEGRKLDLIGFDACVMGMVETGYAMRDIARVMVGSEELEPGDGWNYADWLRRLVEFPNMDTATLGETIVASYRRAYQDRDSTVTLSAVDLGQMPKLAGLIDDLAGELLRALPAELANIQLARGACAVYAPGYGLHGIDLARLCEQLSAATTDAAIQAKARAVQAAVAASVIANYAGEDRQDDYGSHGLAIYFPESRALFKTDPDGLGYLKTNTAYPVEFVQSFRWADFLQAYYALVP